MESRKLQIFILIKFGDKKFMENLWNKGEIYMNTIDWFRKHEENDQKKDQDEGICWIEQLKKIIIKAEDGFTMELNKAGPDSNLIDAQLKEYDRKMSGNIYSLFAISKFVDEKYVSTEIDIRNKDLGDHFVIIYNVNEFFKRLFRKLNETRYSYRYNVVSYYDQKSYSGELSIFQKSIKYIHQKEFRIYVENNLNKPIKFEIGSLNDISKLLKSSDLDRLKLIKEQNILRGE